MQKNKKVSVYNIANILVFIRLGLLPVLFFTLYSDNIWVSNYLSCAILCVCFITDYFDGYFARKYNLVTTLGKILDPIADKIAVFIAFVILANTKFVGMMEIGLVAIMIFREFFVSGLRAFMESIGKRIDVTFLAKIKTTIQMVAATLLVLGNPISSSGFLFNVYIAGQTLLVFATIITVITGWQYFKGSIKYILD